MYSSTHNFLFIHTPKTAGNAIQSVLKSYSNEYIACVSSHHDGVERFEVRSKDYKIRKHATLSEYRQQIGDDAVNRAFKFSCTRNPWERMISFYFSPHRGDIQWNRDHFKQFLENAIPSSNYIESPETKNNAGNESAFSAMDYFVRFEHLDQDFDELCGLIGISHQPLQQRNASSHQPYQHYYDEELNSIVEDRFSEEIAFFGYCFQDN